MGPTWVLSAPDGSHVGPMYLAIRMAQGQMYDCSSVSKVTLKGMGKTNL